MERVVLHRFPCKKDWSYESRQDIRIFDTSMPILKKPVKEKILQLHPEVAVLLKQGHVVQIRDTRFVARCGRAQWAVKHIHISKRSCHVKIFWPENDNEEPSDILETACTIVEEPAQAPEGVQENGDQPEPHKAATPPGSPQVAQSNLRGDDQSTAPRMLASPSAVAEVLGSGSKKKTSKRRQEIEDEKKSATVPVDEPIGQSSTPIVRQTAPVVEPTTSIAGTSAPVEQKVMDSRKSTDHESNGNHATPNGLGSCSAPANAVLTPKRKYEKKKKPAVNMQAFNGSPAAMDSTPKKRKYEKKVKETKQNNAPQTVRDVVRDRIAAFPQSVALPMARSAPIRHHPFAAALAPTASIAPPFFHRPATYPHQFMQPTPYTQHAFHAQQAMYRAQIITRPSPTVHQSVPVQTAMVHPTAPVQPAMIPGQADVRAPTAVQDLPTVEEPVGVVDNWTKAIDAIHAAHRVLHEI